MRKIYPLFLAALLVTAGTFAQSPQKFSYQAVVRDADGALLQNMKVGIKISLLRGSVSGTVVYAETHNAITNDNGLISVAIGEGTALTDNIASINWANGPYFIKTETDPSGGTSYTITGTIELLSVPYSLFSANAILSPGSAAGNTPFWNGSAWVANNSNIFNNGRNIGIGTATPSARFDIAGANVISSATLSNLMVNVGAGDHTIQVNIRKFDDGSSNFYLYQCSCPVPMSYTSMIVISR